MARRKQSNKAKSPQRQRRPRREAAPDETRAAEGITVAWMLAAMGCGLCELIAVAGLAALAYPPVAAALPERASVFPWLLLFVAVITGTITLLLTPLVLRQRQDPPPSSVVNFAVGVGVAAWVLAIGSIWFPA